MQPATQIAKSVLHLKSPRARAFASEMGRNHRGPHDYLTSRKVSAACRFIKAIAPEARRYFIAERKARWLTDVIVHRDGRQIFELSGAFEGQPYDIHIDLPGDATLLDFLAAVMRHRGAPLIMRMDAAKIAAPLVHRKPKPEVVVVERPCTARPKSTPRENIVRVGSPEWRMKISAAIKRGNERRRLALAASDAAEPAVARDYAGDALGCKCNGTSKSAWSAFMRHERPPAHSIRQQRVDKRVVKLAKRQTRRADKRQMKREQRGRR
jgi:hypothetical protein